MKVIILCGGVGSRLAEETKLIPKPMVKIGNKPILSHIMTIYKHYDFRMLCSHYNIRTLQVYNVLIL